MNIAPSTPFQSGSTKLVSLGTKYADPYGRVWFYAEAGGTNLARGKLVVEATVAGNHVNLSWQTAPAIGDRVVKVTLGATLTAADDYEDGWLVVEDGTGEGRAYLIEGHPAAASAATQELTLKEAIDTAGATGQANVDLIKNPFKDVVISVTDQADMPVGVPVKAITADQFGWVQTWGPCSVLMDEAITVGQAVTIGSSVAGSVEALDAAGEPQVGIMGATAGVDTEYQLIYLTLRP